MVLRCLISSVPGADRAALVAPTTSIEHAYKGLRGSLHSLSDPESARKSPAFSLPVIDEPRVDRVLILFFTNITITMQLSGYVALSMALAASAGPVHFGRASFTLQNGKDALALK